MSASGGTRRAYHAGSWYSDEADVLRKQLDSYLAAAGPGELKEKSPNHKGSEDD